ncbi:unnamed protein product [Rhizophagus irregularis]|uniref:CCHC-type domain-containing protein n=1 Tax=Rhizophagus irregularis TaxID=588596 RepID=A0A916ECJ5_9GLOM|nr:unnamed protein product [Rhizophagus irregularis]
MDLDNNKTDNQQSTRQSSNDKQASNPPSEDLDNQQNGKLSFRARAPFNKILGNNRITKIKFLKSQLYKDYNIVKITTIYQKKNKENLFQIEFNNQDQYNKFINAEFKFMENDEPIKFQIKNDSDKIEKTKEKEVQKLCVIQVLNIPLNYKPYEIRAIFSKYGKIEDLYTRVKVRVIPLLLNDESREDRYRYALKLTGLLFGTTGRELTELLKGSGAKSVVISRNPKNYNLLKYAMVYFPDEDVLTEAASLKLNIKRSILFWFNLDEKACHVCGSPEHIAKDCDKERQIKPKYLNRTQAFSQFKKKKSSSYADVTKEGNNNKRRQQSYPNNNRREWNEKNIIHDNPYMGNNGHRQSKSVDPVRQDIKYIKDVATTSFNNNNKRVHIEDSGLSSDSGMDEFEAKLSKSDEKIEQNMTLLTQIAKKLDSLSSKITSSSNTAGLEDGDNAIVED